MVATVLRVENLEGRGIYEWASADDYPHRGYDPKRQPNPGSDLDEPWGHHDREVFGFPSVRALQRWWRRNERMRLYRHYAKHGFSIAVYTVERVCARSPHQLTFIPQQCVARVPLNARIAEIRKAVSDGLYNSANGTFPRDWHS